MKTARAIWICGVPASGKTTLARGLVAAYHAHRIATLWLDSDDLRTVLTPEPTYSDLERDRFYAAIAHLARLAVEGGVTAVISATAASKRHRLALREAVARYVEIELTCTPRALRGRDIKGLYRAADAGELDRLPGIGVPFESATADLVIDTTATDPDAVFAEAWAFLKAGRVG